MSVYLSLFVDFSPHTVSVYCVPLSIHTCIPHPSTLQQTCVKLADIVCRRVCWNDKCNFHRKACEESPQRDWRIDVEFLCPSPFLFSLFLKKILFIHSAPKDFWSVCIKFKAVRSRTKQFFISWGESHSFKWKSTIHAVDTASPDTKTWLKSQGIPNITCKKI